MDPHHIPMLSNDLGQIVNELDSLSRNPVTSDQVAREFDELQMAAVQLQQLVIRIGSKKLRAAE